MSERGKRCGQEEDGAGGIVERKRGERVRDVGRDSVNVVPRVDA